MSKRDWRTVGNLPHGWYVVNPKGEVVATHETAEAALADVEQRRAPHRPAQLLTNTTDRIELAAREWGNLNGYFGAKGGHIYKARSQADATAGWGAHVTQGWFNFWTEHQTGILDHFTRELTAFGSFRDLTNPPSSTYRPTLRVRRPGDWRPAFLADQYDRAMKAKRDPRRAYRGTDA